MSPHSHILDQVTTSTQLIYLQPHGGPGIFLDHARENRSPHKVPICAPSPDTSSLLTDILTPLSGTEQVGNADLSQVGWLRGTEAKTRWAWWPAGTSHQGDARLPGLAAAKLPDRKGTGEQRPGLLGLHTH